MAPGRWTIRPARSEDVEALRVLDQRAFSELQRQLTGKPVSLPLRESAYFEHWLRTDPEGALVAEEEGQLVGLNFNHARGRSAWIGPLAVHPRWQGRGLGRALLEAGLAYLERRGCGLIGLDTFANNPVSVGLYLKHGFAIVGGLLLLSAPLAQFPRSEPPPGWQLSPVTPADLPSIAALEERYSGFQRLPDFQFHLAWEEACAFKLTAQGEIKGYFFGLTKRGEASCGPLYLSADVSPPAGLPPLLGAVADFFAARGRINGNVHASGRNLWLAGYLLAHGFQITRTMVRMVRTGEPPGEPLGTPFASEKG
ncbi:MAG TPA: GNAT family N-acetyltransferase [Armatimonadetes bacterium]|nr:GNAT family N-acetyltransferase [Armatimonadota bacterium]